MLLPVVFSARAAIPPRCYCGLFSGARAVGQSRGVGKLWKTSARARALCDARCDSVLHCIGKIPDFLFTNDLTSVLRIGPAPASWRVTYDTKKKN